MLYPSTTKLPYWFKQVVVVGNERPISDESFHEKLHSWIRKYNEWFLTVSGINNQQNLHFLYGRSIELVAEKGLAANHTLCASFLSEIARGGYSISMTAPVHEINRSLSYFFEFLTKASISRLGIDCCNLLPPKSNHPEIVQIAERAIENGIQVAFIGESQLLKQSGVFSAGSINSSDVTVYPLNSSTYFTKEIADISNSADKFACHTHFRVYIDSDGSIYPCLGLLGVPDACLGTTNEPFESSLFMNEQACCLLNEWATEGPDLAANKFRLAQQTSLPDMAVLPLQCSLHRALLIDTIKKAASTKQ